MISAEMIRAVTVTKNGAAADKAAFVRGGGLRAFLGYAVQVEQS